MKLVRIKPEYDSALAEIIRCALKENHLDIPGTAYFDPQLDHLSSYYQSSPDRDYYVLLDEKNQAAGGIGLSDFPGLKDCAELQKLYLAPHMQGRGYGYEMIRFIRNKASEMGYHQLYLETHHNLEAAIHMYEKSGFQRIERLPECVHGTMDIFFLLSAESLDI